MDDLLRRPFPLLRTLTSVAVLTALAASVTEAAPLFNHAEGAAHLHRPSVHESSALAQFLAGGVDHWINAKPPRIPSGVTIRYRDGTLKNTLLVSYLEWRRAQDPDFFDRRHPRLGAILASAMPATTTPGAVPFSSALEVLSPPKSALELVAPPAGATALELIGSQGGTPQAGGPSPVPEPSTLGIAAMLLGVAAVWTRSRPPR